MTDEKNLPGRPTVMTPEVVGKLENAFANGCNISEACLFAGISRDSYYDYDKITAGFGDRMKELRNMPNLKARLNLVERVKDGDVEASKWWLERRNKDEFGTKSTVDTNHTGTIQLVNDIPPSKLDE